MSDFHYVRTLGEDGGVDMASAAAIGLDLESVLRDGLPPHSVVLQILAGLCEILDIAEEDGRIHGDMQLAHVFVDDTGAISLEGFGQRRTRAPESRPQGSVTDLYGLGLVGFELFAGHPLPDVNRRHRDDHDDDVIDAILNIQFGDLNEVMVGDVQWFLAKLMSFDPDERPSAVETWRTFVAFAEEARGPEFIGWCLDALDGLGERRSPDGSVIQAAAAPVEQKTADLGGPVVSQGPLDKGGMSFNTANVAGGTAFFSKADMKAALAKAPAESPRDRQPAVGGGAATNYWSRDQLKAMAEGGQEAPRPKRAAGEGARRRTMATTKADLDRAQEREADAARRIPPAPPVPQPSHAPAPEVSHPPEPLHQQTVDSPAFGSDFGSDFDNGEQTVRMTVNSVRTTHTPAPAPQVYRPPNAPPLPPPVEKPKRVPPPSPKPAERVVSEPPKDSHKNPPRVPQSGGGKLPVEPPVPPYEPEAYDSEEGGGGSANLLIGFGIAMVVVIALVVCLGLGGLSAALAMFSGSGSADPTEAAPTEAPAPLPVALPVVAPGDGEPVPVEPTPDEPAKPAPVKPAPKPAPVKPTPRTKPEPVRPKPSPVPSSGSRPPPGPVGRPAPSPAPVPVPSEPATLDSKPATLTLKSKDRGKLQCCGTRKSFDGAVSLNIEAYKLPCVCMVTIDKAREAFQVYSTGSVACSKKDDAVICNKSSVP